MGRASLIACFALAGLSAPIAQAALPSYSIQFQARAGGGPVNSSEPHTSFTDNQPQINNSYNVAIRVNNVGTGSEAGIWFGGGGHGSIVYAPEGQYVGDVSLNNSNLIVFPQSGTNGPGVFFYDTVTGNSDLITAGPDGTNGWLSPKVNDSGQVGVTFTYQGGGAQYVVLPPGVQSSSGSNVYASNTVSNSSSPYCALNGTAFNNQGQFAGIVRIGPTSEANDNLAPDEIRRFNSDGSYTVMARDMQSDASSQSFMFEQLIAPAMNNNGLVAYVSRTETCGCAFTRAVFLSDGTTTTMFGGPDVLVHRVEGFSPALSDNNLVAFRGEAADGLATIYVGDGTSVERIIGVGDTLMTDLGPRVIGDLIQAPAIDSRGDLAFAVAFTDASGGGTALYTAYVPEPSALALAVLGAAVALRRRRI